MEEQGLAQQQAQQPQGMGKKELMELVLQVAKLLQQGISPQELVQKGVPEEVVRMAVQMTGQAENSTNREEVPAGQSVERENGLAMQAAM